MEHHPDEQPVFISGSQVRDTLSNGEQVDPESCPEHIGNLEQSHVGNRIKKTRQNTMTDRPNILVIMTDQQRATASHLYGNTFCQTPSMNAYQTAACSLKTPSPRHPLCVPARISFWTSQFPHSHGGRRNQTLMPAGATHAWQLWKAAGYATGLIGKNHCFEQEEDLALFRRVEPLYPRR